ncbi:hypothetical protein [Endozoicomonas montiporae]|uniref:Uncharacterized protein n=1 Tax=Endozoicomonas montiporae CL-33 TaxID=570277 RepID=A0A142BIJ8_9GAMM|nr:hypothetical protein [Endozoicomonas montiporae]AMO58574.1 hypothetical protein EZMO1_4669 [Endozoicomonas montiporae CL-33]
MCEPSFDTGSTALTGFEPFGSTGLAALEGDDSGWVIATSVALPIAVTFSLVADPLTYCKVKGYCGFSSGSSQRVVYARGEVVVP